jgi:predicted CopG family antitoxin
MLNLYKRGFDMKTLNISISDIEYNKLGLKNDKLNFSDFVELVSNELSRQNLNKCVELAEKYGLSKITMDEIGKEVKAVRKFE